MSHYDTLGVSADASSEEIKKAYRALARTHHPDKGGGKQAEERFKSISSAYAILSDPDKRREYDEELTWASQPRGGGRDGVWSGPPNGQGMYTDEDLASMFSGLGLDDLFAGMSGGGRRTGRRGSDVHASLDLDFDDTLESIVVPLRMSAQVPCATCHGQGCQACRGQGWKMQEKTVKARIPAGVSDGATIRLAGKGASGSGGGANGDLLLEVHVAAHEVFSIVKGIVCLDVPVSIVEASLGGSIDVPLPRGGNAVVKVPAGSQDGRVLRIKGKGIKNRDGKAGDVHARVRVVVPKKLSARAKASLRELAEELDDDVREDLRAKARA